MPDNTPNVQIVRWVGFRVVFTTLHLANRLTRKARMMRVLESEVRRLLRICVGMFGCSPTARSPLSNVTCDVVLFVLGRVELPKRFSAKSVRSRLSPTTDILLFTTLSVLRSTRLLLSTRRDVVNCCEILTSLYTSAQVRTWYCMICK